MEWFVNWSIWHWLILGFVLLIAEDPSCYGGDLRRIVVAGIMKLFPAFTSFSSSSNLRHYCHHLSVIWWRYQHSKDQADQSQKRIKPTGSCDDWCCAGRGVRNGRKWHWSWCWRYYLQRIKGHGLSVNDLIEVTGVNSITLNVIKIKE